MKFKMKTQSPHIGNTRAAKPEDAQRTTRIAVNLTPKQKAAWVHAARGAKLIDWIRETCDRAAE